MYRLAAMILKTPKVRDKWDVEDANCCEHCRTTIFPYICAKLRNINVGANIVRPIFDSSKEA